MGYLPLAVGLAIGLIGGAAIGYWIARRAMNDAESVVEALSAKVVTKQTEHILHLAETKLAGKKDVIDETLKSMKGMMESIGKENAKVGTRLEHAATVIKDLTETTGNLRNALTSNSNRGQWGERMAEDVLRLSGLVEGINYIKQKKLEAAGSKPDFTFLLPQGLKLNMDVKFPFNNYQLYAEAKNDRDRDIYKKAFVKDVKDRIKELQSRDYINPQDNTVDYVLLFIPNEQIFAFINEVDRALIDEAMKSKTILCSPLSLYAVLAVIRQSIDNFNLESKSREMLTLFGSFKQQWEKFKEQMETVQNRFEQVHKGYEELTGVRERQLDKPLARIEELRTHELSAASDVDDATKKLVQRAVAKATSPV
ncbi:MAG: hypothetical protein G01um101425_996 [Candidatus Peregrinibacteria bacterium Gr01-1014_25]|nr:MAG: hypothetical protein G01um101425_996 [Candidatus Peregrinibacteria bacterium Gr01-1014_25]